MTPASITGAGISSRGASRVAVPMRTDRLNVIASPTQPTATSPPSLHRVVPLTPRRDSSRPASSDAPATAVMIHGTYPLPWETNRYQPGVGPPSNADHGPIQNIRLSSHSTYVSG